MLLNIAEWKNEKLSGSQVFGTIAQKVMAGLSWFDRQQEHFFVIGLDTKNKIQYIDRATTGTLDASLVHPRETFRQAIAYGVSSIALMHNHPSGDVTPSSQDKDVTKRISNAGKLLGIDVLDHMIVGSNDLTGDTCSLKEHDGHVFARTFRQNEFENECLREEAMANSSDELEAMKKLPINFAAASFGYRILKAKSSKHSAVMVGKDGHKIICSTSRKDGHGIFFSTDGQTSGSIIDLVQHITGDNLGGVRKALRPLLQAGGLSHQVDEAGWKLVPAATDFLGVLARFSNFEPVTSPHPFLSVTRQIPDTVLLSERFNGRVFHDPDRGTAIFPHYGSPDGSKDRCLTGYSIKHDSLTMFSKGGKKGLFFSNAFETDTQLVISEAAIDALSYACLKTNLKIARFISTGGQLNPEQPALIRSAIEKLPSPREASSDRGEVIAAVDNDEGGDQLARTIAKIFDDVGRKDLTFRIDVPETRGFDWNRELTQG